MNQYEKLNLDTDMMFKMGVLASQWYKKYTGRGSPFDSEKLEGMVRVDHDGTPVAEIDFVEYGYPVQYGALIDDPAVTIRSGDSIEVTRLFEVVRGGVMYRIKSRFVAYVPDEEVQFLADCGIVELNPQSYNTVACVR